MMKKFNPTQSVHESISQIASIANTNHPLAKDAKVCLQKLYTLSYCPLNHEASMVIIGIDHTLFIHYTHVMQIIVKERHETFTSSTLQDIQHSLQQALNPVSLLTKIAHTALLFSKRNMPILTTTIEHLSPKTSLKPQHEKSD